MLLRAYAIYGQAGKAKYRGLGFPDGIAYRDADGNVHHELIITPETDIDNPLVIEFIQDWQERHRPKPGTLGLVPLPKIPDNAKENDWRPLIEYDACVIRG